MTAAGGAAVGADALLDRIKLSHSGSGGGQHAVHVASLRVVALDDAVVERGARGIQVVEHWRARTRIGDTPLRNFHFA